MGKFDSIEQLVERVAQNYSEAVSERNRLRDELAVKDEEIERVKRECAAEIEQMREQLESRDKDSSQFDSRIEALHNRLEAILESRVSEVLMGE